MQHLVTVRQETTESLAFSCGPSHLDEECQQNEGSADHWHMFSKRNGSSLRLACLFAAAPAHLPAPLSGSSPPCRHFALRGSPEGLQHRQRIVVIVNCRCNSLTAAEPLQRSLQAARRQSVCRPVCQPLITPLETRACFCFALLWRQGGWRLARQSDKLSSPLSQHTSWIVLVLISPLANKTPCQWLCFCLVWMLQ